MAKNGWKLSKVATWYYREYPVAFGQKREIVGVGQSDTANNILYRYCFQVHPFLAKKAPGTPVFGQKSTGYSRVWPLPFFFCEEKSQFV